MDTSIKNYNKTTFYFNSKKICDSYIADSFFKRFKGLMFSKSIEDRESLLLTKTNSIHMFFMNYNIDVLFLDKTYKIIDIKINMKKRTISKIYKNVENVLEFKANYLKQFNLKIGDILERI
jgi:uncharacterized membrane protein (UPF0127 family)